MQHDHLNMLKPDMYLTFVDSFADDSTDLTHVALLFKQLKYLQNQLEDLRQQEQDRLQKVDFLEFQIQEIEQVHLLPGEEEEHILLRDRIRNAGKLAEGAARVLQLLYEGEDGVSAFDQVARAREVVQGLEEDSFFSSLMALLDEAYFSITGAASQNQSFSEQSGLRTRVFWTR